MKFFLRPFQIRHAQEDKSPGFVHHAPVDRTHHKFNDIAPP